MAQFDNTLETNMLQEIVKIVSGGYIRIFSGPVPTDTNAADPTGLLVTLQLPPNALAISGLPTGGVKTTLGTAIIAAPIPGTSGTLTAALGAAVIHPTPPILDGTAQNFNDNGTSVVMTLTTTLPNDLVFVCIESPMVPSSLSGGGLTWTALSNTTTGAGVQLRVYSALAAQPLTNATITVGFTSTTDVWVGAVAVANSSLTLDGSAITQNAAGTDLQFTTTATNDLVLAFWNHANDTSPPVASGWTTIWGNTNKWAVGQFRVVPTASTISCQDGALSDANGGIAWAVKQLSATRLENTGVLAQTLAPATMGAPALTIGTLAETLAPATMSAPALAIGATAQNFNDSGTSVAVTLSTTVPNDLVFVCLESAVALSSLSGGGLTWTQVATTVTNSGVTLDVYSAPTTTPLSSAVITATYATTTDVWMGAVSVSNVSYTLDGSPVIQDTAGTDNPITTTQANDLVLAFWNHANDMSPPVASGWTSIWGDTNKWALGQYKFVATPGSVSTQDGDLADANGGIAWAVKPL